MIKKINVLLIVIVVLFCSSCGLINANTSIQQNAIKDYQIRNIDTNDINLVLKNI